MRQLEEIPSELSARFDHAHLQGKENFIDANT
jgi:hypothetical protein